MLPVNGVPTSPLSYHRAEVMLNVIRGSAAAVGSTAMVIPPTACEPVSSQRSSDSRPYTANAIDAVGFSLMKYVAALNSTLPFAGAPLNPRFKVMASVDRDSTSRHSTTPAELAQPMS